MFPLSRSLWLAALAVFIAYTSPSSAASKTEAAKERAEGEKQSIEKKLSTLREELSSKERQSKEASRRIQKADQAISKANLRINALKSERDGVERRLTELRRSHQSVSASLSDAENLVEQIARAQFLNARRRSWQSLIDGTNPNEKSRLGAELRYLALAQTRAVANLEAEQKRILGVRAETQSRRLELTRIAKEEEQSRAELLNERRDRQKALKQLADEVASKQNEIGRLLKDQARLSDLVASLDKKIAKERAEAERKRAASASSQPVKHVALKKGGNFAKLKGRLPQPVIGRVASRFGATRSGSAKWQGLLFETKANAPVKACSAGTVVFADWLRGYGNLLIIDHGNTYMTVYAHADSLRKQVGDSVKAGEVIAQTGSPNGDDHGLYFEIRHRGKPVNPTPWFGK